MKNNKSINDDDSPTKLLSQPKRGSSTDSQDTSIYNNLINSKNNANIDGMQILKNNHNDGAKQKEMIQLNQKLLSSENIQEQSQNTKVEIDLFRVIKIMAKSKQFTAIAGLTGAFIIHLIVGAIYRWNMISGYVGIYFNNNRQTPIGAPLAMLCVGLTMRLGYMLSQKYGSRLILSISVCLVFASNLVSSQMNSFQSFLFFHNVCFGLSAGLLFLPPIQQCHKFFPNLKLITNSIILTGTGLGSVMFGSINIQCIQNKMDIYNITDQQLISSVNQYFCGCILQMSFVILFLGIVGVALMVPMIIQNQVSNREIKSYDKELYTHSCKNQCQSFQSRVFWIVGIIIFLSSCGNYYVIANFKNLLQVDKQKKGYLYWVLISGAFGNGISRLFWGFAFSRVGFKILFCLAAFLNILSFLIIMCTTNQAAYIIFYTLNSISLGGYMVIIPNVSLIIFGKKIGESIYSYYWIIFSLSNLLQFGVTLVFLTNQSSSIGYSRVLLFFIVSTSTAIYICCKQVLEGPWKNSLDLVEFKRVQQVKQNL